jgi:chromosome segregation ATPase
MGSKPLSERISALEETVAGLQHLPNELAAFRKDVNTRFERIDARFERIDARFEQIDARFEQIDARFDRIEARLDGHDSRFDRIEARISEESDRLYARMRILHEELVERIKTIGEGRSRDAQPPRRRSKR